MLFTWKAVVDTGDGCAELTGEQLFQWGDTLHVRAELPQGHIRSVSARVPLCALDGEKIFMNGYQTWTSCPEYGVDDRIIGLTALPRSLIQEFGYDRYGDYHFVKYPNRRGVTHGESWCYFRALGAYRLIASLDEKPGYTLFQYDAQQSLLTVRRDCEGIRCGGTYPLFDLICLRGGEGQVFDGWFGALGVSPLPAPKLRGYTSWYNRFTAITEETVRADLKGCVSLLSPGDLFQVDDGWEPAVGDWLEPDREKFPSGMKALADEIHAAGFKAGLWLSPFVAKNDSALVREHPDWVLRVNGEPWSLGANWGGFCALDVNNPQVLDYVRRVLDRVIHQWGFDLLKLDFLYGAAPFGTETETRAGKMIRMMDLLREICGDVPILGCGVPVMPAFGRVEYCRISCDASLTWDGNPREKFCHRERVSSRLAILNTLFRRQLNGRAHINDPDVFFLRDDNIYLTQEQKLLLGRINALLGGVLLMSDDPTSYTYAQREAYRELVRLSTAENVRFDPDRFEITFTLDGEENVLPIPLELF